MDNIEIWISEDGYATLSSFQLYETVTSLHSLEYMYAWIYHLKPDTRYWIMIRTVDSTDPNIKGAFSAPIELTTEIDDYPEFYDGVFEVWISEYGNSYDTFTKIATETLNTALPSYTFDNLKPDTRYWIMVREIYPPSGAIKGSFSEVIEIRTSLSPDTGRRLLLSTDGINFYAYSGVIISSGSLVLSELEPDEEHYAKIKGIETSEESNTVYFKTLSDVKNIDDAGIEEADHLLSGLFFRSSSTAENSTMNIKTISAQSKSFIKKKKYYTEVD